MARHVDHDQRRAEILHGVYLVIAQHGLTGVSLRSVAAAAGVSLGRVQHYFGSKDELVVQACQAIVDAAERRYLAAGTTTRQAQLRELAISALPATEEARVGASVWLAFTAAAASNPSLRNVVAEAWAGTESEIVGLLKAGARAGELHATVDPIMAARSLTASIHGFVALMSVGVLTHRQAVTSLGAQVGSLFE